MSHSGAALGVIKTMIVDTGLPGNSGIGEVGLTMRYLRSGLRRVVTVLVTLTALAAIVGSSSAGCKPPTASVGYKPPYVPIQVSANTLGELTVSFNPEIVTPIGTFSAEVSPPPVDIGSDGTLLAIRHWRQDTQETVVSLFQVRGIAESDAKLVVNGDTDVKVSREGTTTIIDVPVNATSFTIEVDKPEAVEMRDTGSTTTWSEPSPTPSPTGTELPIAAASTTPTETPVAEPLRMPIDDVESITGRGTLVTGVIEQGAVRTGDSIVIVAQGKKPIPSVVAALVVSGKAGDRGETGDTVGVLLRGVSPTAVATGDVLRAP
jgi:hypothetical protein